MAESLFSANGQDAPADLISFLKAIPDGRYRRGVRYPQWFLLLVAVLGLADRHNCETPCDRTGLS
jgi:type VI protein secretion system component VasF